MAGHIVQNSNGQQFDYFLVVDFEATCNEDQRGKGALKPQEIIEFPVALVNSATLEVESTFHVYVKPVVHPTLTHFCTQLTGVTQKQVDAGFDLRGALAELEQWMEYHCLDVAAVPSKRRRSFLFVSCGDWDLNHLRSQCKKQKIPEPLWCRRVCNLKHMYEKVFGTKQIGMMGMLEGLKIQHVGMHHCGIDDVRNITAILLKLIKNHKVMFVATMSEVFSFLGPSNAALDLLPRDFITASISTCMSCAHQSSAIHRPSTSAILAGSRLEQLNAHFGHFSYLANGPCCTQADYELYKEIITWRVDASTYPHLNRWRLHICHLMANPRSVAPNIQ